MTLVLWSGGCDSTLALYNAAKDSERKGPLRALSVEHPQVRGAAEHAAARHRLVELLQRDHGVTFQHVTVTLTQRGGFACEGGWGGLYQPIFWLAAAVPYLTQEEDLVVGYIATDHVWHRIAAVRQYFEGMLMVSERSGRLLTPLEWVDKRDVIRILRVLNLESACWYCELPQPKVGEMKELTRRKVSPSRRKRPSRTKLSCEIHPLGTTNGTPPALLGEPCGRCASCRTHQTALWQIEQRFHD